MSPLLELSGIVKRFGAVAAVDGVSLAVNSGEVLAIVGENGAGKTTLMNLAYGLYRPDAGEVRVRGERRDIRSPADAIAAGLGMVHQHFMLVPNLTVAENVALGAEPRRGPAFDRAEAERRVAEVAARYGFALDPRARVDALSVGAQQRVEIVKALSRGADVLILDEPTAVLTPQESAELVALAKALAAAGRAVVFISHKLREVLEVATRIAVMRRGKLVATLDRAEATAARLAELMVGPSTAPGTSGGVAPGTSGGVAPGTSGSAALGARRPAGATRREPGAPVLEMYNVHAASDRGVEALRGISLSVRAGELVAIAGVDGNGQSELAEVVTGLRAPTKGTLSLGGEDVTGLGPRALRDRGVVHIPEDRQRRGLALPLTVAENASLGREGAPPFAKPRFGVWWLDRAARRERAAKLVKDYDVRPPDPDALARDLSGGNQQKLIVARELDQTAKLVVAVQPTRGLDVGAIAAVHDRLRAEAARGAAVLIVSLDLDEVLALADRVVVLREGRVAGEADGWTADEQDLGRLMLGSAA